MASKGDRIKTIEIAEKYAQEGKLREAIAEYQKLLVGDVQDINIRSIIGDLYLRLDEKDLAQEEFQQLAAYYEEKGMYPQAIAVYKKINKLRPEDLELAIKLADAYGMYGFFSEAKAMYLRVAEDLEKKGSMKEVIVLYEKIVKLDKEDVEMGLTLTELYENEGLVDQAVEELNTIAEFNLQKERLKEAEKTLIRAQRLKGSHLRTITNLIDLFKKKNKKKEVYSLLNDILKKDQENLKFLSLLGATYLEDHNFDKAKEIFSKILSLREMDVEARIKLGRIYILEGDLDAAFKLYEPLVDSLIKKDKGEKAISLLGLILSSKEVHLPSLEKIAFIYKSNNLRKELETVYKVILDEYHEKGLKEKSLSILEELVELCPEEDELAKEYKLIRKELGLLEEEEEEEERIEEKKAEPSESLEEDREIIRLKLAKVDLYLEQGLIRNARRILEDLKSKYVDEPEIDEKIAILDQIRTRVQEEEIPHLIEEVEAKEAKIEKEIVETEEEEEEKVGVKEEEEIPQEIEEVETKEGELEKEEIETREEEKEEVTAADVIAETDVIPESGLREIGKEYYDLTELLEDEVEIIGTIVHNQLKGDTETYEKELSDIVSEFKKEVEEKVEKEDYETHYNLGIAFMEQGLLVEAIEAFKLASKNKKRTVDCYSVISYCYRKKKDFQEGIKWIEKGLELIDKNSTQFFALKYELASLYEEIEERERALTLYNEIKEWNAGYRDVNKKIESLGGFPSE